MKLVKDHDEYPMPPIGELIAMAIDLGEEKMEGVRRSIMRISVDEMEKIRADRSRSSVSGVPTCAAYYSTINALRVWPLPDRDGELIVRYFPPMMEA